METHDITLVWNYTLDGTVALAKFFNVTGGVNVEIGRRFGNSSTTVKSGFQERFRADISDTQAWLKIVRVQRSEQGQYAFDMSVNPIGTLRHVVEVIVQCK